MLKWVLKYTAFNTLGRWNALSCVSEKEREQYAVPKIENQYVAASVL